MTPVSSSLSPRRPASKRAITVGGVAGTTIEYYDFFLYGTAAAVVFDKVFFPSYDPFVGTLLAFATYAVGFVARPFGAALFGHFGDVRGRKASLVVSLMTMGLATFAIAVLPTYASIGVAAPLILVLLRLLQGFGLGGEWGGATLLLSENVEGGRRGFWASLPQIGPALGNLLAAGVLALFSVVMSDAAFVAWGWRIPFALSALLLVLGMWVRLRLTETAVFEQRRAVGGAAAGTPRRLPLVVLVRDHWRALITAICLRLGESAGYYIFTVFVLTYATTVAGLSRSVALGGVLVGTAVECLLVPVFGHLSDRVGRRVVYLGAAVALVGWVFVFFHLVDLASFGALVLATAGAGAIHAAFAGPQGAYFSELFSTDVRYSGISLGFNIGAVLGGSLTPIIALTLYQVFGTAIAISAYVAVLAAATLAATAIAGDTRRVELDETGSLSRQSAGVPHGRSSHDL